MIQETKEGIYSCSTFVFTSQYLRTVAGDQLRIKGHPCFTVLAATINLVCKQILTLNPRLCVRWKALNYC